MKLLLLALLGPGLLAGAPVVAAYSAEIRRENAGRYLVHVIARVSGGVWSRPSFTLGPFRTGAFAGCVSCQTQALGILQRLTPAGVALPGVIEVTYRVAAAAAGDREYIPLAVPEISGSAAAGSVEITVFPGEGPVPGGDMFPVLNAAGDGQWTVRMANMVNHVEFNAKGAWFGPRQWSDLAVAILILAGLVVRAGLVRKAKSA